MEAEIESLKNNNYLAQPVTFIVVPKRRYTLPFVSRNIYIEELVNDAAGDNEENDKDEEWSNDTELLLSASREMDQKTKDRFNVVLNNVIRSLMRETKKGISKKGRMLRKKLGLKTKTRSKSAGYGVRDRFHLCPSCPCQKLRKVKAELARMRGPAIHKMKKIIKSKAKILKDNFKTRSEEDTKKVQSLKDTNEGNTIKNSKIDHNDNQCLVVRKLTALKKEVVHLYKENKNFGKKVQRKESNSSFYLDEKDYKGITRLI